MHPDLTHDTPEGPSAWFGLVPVLGAVAALNAYAGLAAFPSMTRPSVPLAAPLAAAAFAALQLALPACRPTRHHLLSPLNWVLLAFFLQIVAVPLLVAWQGPAVGTLSYLPGERAIDRSIVLSVVAFAAFSLGYSLSTRRCAPASRPALRIPAVLIALYFGLGGLGLLLRFHSVGEMIGSFTDPSRFRDASVEVQGSLRGAAGTFLRPFLLTAIVMAWCAWIDRRGPVASARVARWAPTIGAAVGVAIVGATYSFNRAAFVVPLVAMAATYSVHVRRLSFPTLAATASFLAVLAIVPGRYRAANMTAAELAQSKVARREVFVPEEHDLRDQVQVYATAPQFTGYLLEASERSNEKFTPGVLAASLLSPVPIVGKAFRESSGPAIYNRLIYGNTGIADQNIPFEGEVYLCLGPAGLLAAFALIGLAVERLQRSFARAASAFDSYALQFTGVWIAFLVPGSLAAMAQIFVFFFWPIYGYALLRLSRRAASRAR